MCGSAFSRFGAKVTSTQTTTFPDQHDAENVDKSNFMDITPIHFILSLAAGFLVFVVLPAMLLVLSGEDAAYR